MRDLCNPFFTDVARGAYIDLFQEQRVHGLLISPQSEDFTCLHALRERGTPTVLVGRQEEAQEFSSVSVDDVACGYMAVRHLYGLGRRHIAFVGGLQEIRQVSDRLRGAQKAIDEVHGASLGVIKSGCLTVLHGRAIGEALRDRAAFARPGAVFAVNDLLAFGVLRAPTMLGDVCVPQDGSLVGSTAVDLLLREVAGRGEFVNE